MKIINKYLQFKPEGSDYILKCKNDVLNDLIRKANEVLDDKSFDTNKIKEANTIAVILIENKIKISETLILL
jgi:hypothetical protein